MAKTINLKERTPLVMENGAEVNNLEELQNNFSITSITDYLESGELVAWLRSRYYDDIADEVEVLDSCDDDVDEKLYKIFEVDNPETAEKKAEQEKEKAEKLKKLQKFLGDDTYKEYISVIDKIAFTQDDLYDFLDAGQNKIYLCGEKFEVPISVQNVTYVGIGEPLVTIRLKGIMNLEEERGIKFEGVKFGITEAKDMGMRFRIGIREGETMSNIFIRKALERPLMELGYDEERWQKLVDEMTNETENAERKPGVVFFNLTALMGEPGAGILEKIYELGNPDNAPKYEKFLESHGYEIRSLYNACFE